jgi:Mitochondrial K+-H+ exchange-related
MDVYLVPVGGSRYALYCELSPAEPAPGHESVRASWWSRQKARFRALVDAAEEDRRRRERGEPRTGGRLRRALLGRVAAAVTEQRLLWNLRGVHAGRVYCPDDLQPEQALAILRASLRQDFEKHRRWCIVDSLLFLLFVPLTVIPGPNLPALYFSFRGLGHFFSLRGARQGLVERFVWTVEASPHLAAIRGLIDLDPAVRRERLESVSAALGLETLAGFVARVARPLPADRGWYTRAP